MTADTRSATAPWTRPTHQLDDLLSVLGGIPRLPGATCVGRHQLFDWDGPQDEDSAAREDRLEHAAAVCLACPALGPCADWLKSLPRSQRPIGAVAGRIVRPRRTRKRGISSTTGTGSSTTGTRPPPARRPKADRARTWLADYLDGRGPVPLNVIVGAGKAKGLSRSLLYQVSDELGVVATGSVHAALGSDGRPHWELPETRPRRALGDQDRSDGETTAIATGGRT